MKKWEPHAAEYSQPHGSIHRACTVKGICTHVGPCLSTGTESGQRRAHHSPSGWEGGLRNHCHPVRAGSLSRGKLPLSILQNDPWDSCMERSHGHSQVFWMKISATGLKMPNLSVYKYQIRISTSSEKLLFLPLLRADNSKMRHFTRRLDRGMRWQRSPKSQKYQMKNFPVSRTPYLMSKSMKGCIKNRESTAMCAVLESISVTGDWLCKDFQIYWRHLCKRSTHEQHKRVVFSSRKSGWQAILADINVFSWPDEITHCLFCSCYFNWWPSHLNLWKIPIPRAATDLAVTWKDLTWSSQLLHIEKNTKIDTNPMWRCHTCHNCGRNPRGEHSLLQHEPFRCTLSKTQQTQLLLESIFQSKGCIQDSRTETGLLPVGSCNLPWT